MRPSVCLGITAIAFTLGLGVGIVIFCGDNINARTCSRIRPGMTKPEIETLLERFADPRGIECYAFFQPPPTETWTGQRGKIVVTFDAWNGAATKAEFRKREQNGPIDELIRLIKELLS